jgi:gliding motility-associated-like protein
MPVFLLSRQDDGEWPANLGVSARSRPDRRCLKYLPEIFHNAGFTYQPFLLYVRLMILYLGAGIMYSALRAFILPSMKSLSRFLKGIALTIFAVGAALSADAQYMPICSGTGAGNIYFVSHDSIFKMNPVTTAFTWTGITMPISAGVPTASALAVSMNLNSSTPSPTYYTTLYNGTSHYVNYWNGSAWIGTGHILNSPDIGAGGGYVFSLDTSSGFVFRYAGTGNGVFMVNAYSGVTPQPGRSRDIAVDCQGNFYVLLQTNSPAILRKFSPTGPATYALSATYTLTGTYTAGAGGLAINGNNVYYDGADGRLYTGVISGTNVNFSASSTQPFIAFPAADFGSCGYAGYNGNQGARDTLAYCNGANNISLTATGSGPYNWTVLSGSATITGSGQTVTINSPTTSTIVYSDANCSGTNSIVDTTVLYVANGSLDAGPDRTLYGCGGFITDSIRANLTNTTPGVLYVFNWSHKPATPPVIIGSPNDTVVHFQITKTTMFYVTVNTDKGCSWNDSVKITVVDSTPKADFQYVYHYGCNEDTVCFFNTSRPINGIDSFAWDFRDSIGNNQNWYYTDAVSPCHIFKGQGFYLVKLLAKNAYCQDTISKQINVSHPLLPEFAIDDSTACSDHLFVFSDKSTLPCSNPRYRSPYFPKGCPVTYKYDFGDGTTSTLSSPTHSYIKSGIYTVTLTLQDTFLHCTASISHQIVVDSLPFVKIISADTIVCQGQAVHLHANYLTVGNTGISFDLGDGTKFQNMNDVAYSYVQPGTYTVTLTATYRYCPPAVFTYPFSVRPFPGIDLGPDTVLCPNGAPIILSDRANLGNTTARYIWSTGEKTASIAARNIGLYWARIDIGGCTATDSIMINKDCYVDIPNSFTPNGDGVNDYFLPRQYLSRSVSSFSMMIFNRWGQEIFETKTLDGRGWDGKFNGKDQPQGVYVYLIDVSFDNGTKEHYTGNLTLLR